ncbi:hypothetical protein MD484_g2444, partial [Candolleomyces efflorescens]
MTQFFPDVDQRDKSDLSAFEPPETANQQPSGCEDLRGGGPGAFCSSCGNSIEGPSNSTPSFQADNSESDVKNIGFVGGTGVHSGEVDTSAPQAPTEQDDQTQTDLTSMDSTSGPEPAHGEEKPLPHRPSPNDSESGRKNIIFFGETGVGKSSVINMFREGTTNWRPGSEVPISSGAVGCTFSSEGCEADVDDKRYMLWDTAGLNEGERGTITHEESVQNLAFLLQNLGGIVHLLVYCIRGKRFRQVIKDNYELFYQRFCKARVPIVVVVTGLENEEPDMDSWWTKNKRDFERYGLTFDGWACVTSTRGKAVEGGHMFDEEYEQSQQKVRSLIGKRCSDEGCSVLDWMSDFPGVNGSQAADDDCVALAEAYYPGSRGGPSFDTLTFIVFEIMRSHGRLDQSAFVDSVLVQIKAQGLLTALVVEPK